MSDQETKTEAPKVSTGKMLSQMAGGAAIKAIIPTTLGECFSLSEMVFGAGLAPKGIDKPQTLTVIFMKGMEVGMPPMMAMETIAVINGRACIHSDGIPGLLWSHGFKIREWYTNEDDLENIVAHCEIARPSGDKYAFHYGAKDAKENGLWDMRLKDSKGNPNRAPWFLYKKRMVKMRCRGWLARDCASDVLKGMPIYEEVADAADMIDVTPPAKAGLPAPVELPDDIPLEGEVQLPETISEAEDDQDAPLAKPERYQSGVMDNLAAASTEAIWDEIWAAHEELVEAGRLPGEIVTELETWATDNRKRFDIPSPKKRSKK